MFAVDYRRVKARAMIDGVKCSCVGLDADLWRGNKRLDFGLCVSESTGELLTQKREAIYRGLRFVLTPRQSCQFSCSIAGSLHKYKNGGGANWDNFTFAELCDTVQGLQLDFDIEPSKAQIHSLEIGVNLQLDYKPEIILKNAICHKGKRFDSLNRKDAKIGLVCSHIDYEIKLYDKGYQCKIDQNGKYVLRCELKINRQRMLEPFGIYTLLDLTDAEKMARLVMLLIERLNEIVFFDFSHKGDQLSESKRLIWQRYSNPNYWASLNRRQYYKARVQLASFIEKHNCIDWGKFISKRTTKQWDELMGTKQKNRGQFPRLAKESESNKRGTISNLEYMMENVPTRDVVKRPLDELQNSPRHCISCGRQIDMQRKGARFCSERIFGSQAKRCRNRDSNRRLTLKRKIGKAVENDLMLNVTYTDADLVLCVETLAAREIDVTRQWLDGVVAIELLPPQPITL